MIGRTPSHIQAIRPLRDGVIANFDICEKMLAYFIRRVHGPRKFAKPRMVICVPSGITGVEQRAVQEAAESAGARKPAHIIEEPMAAAIGAGLPVHEPTGNMVVDIGGGTTEVAVISLGGIVTSQSVRIGGDELDEAIIQYIKKEYSLALGERTAEEIKIALGSACPLEEELHAEIRGRDLITGLPKTIVTTTEEIREAIDEPVSSIVDAVKVTLDKTPPELAADIMEQGIVLTGGGALLHGLGARLMSETGMPIVIADNPLHSVAIGSGQCLEEFEVAEGRADVQPESLISGRPAPPWLSTDAPPAPAMSWRCSYWPPSPWSPSTPGAAAAASPSDIRPRSDEAFAPLQHATHSALQPIGNFLSGAIDYGSLRRENQRLRDQVGAPPAAIHPGGRRAVGGPAAVRDRRTCHSSGPSRRCRWR